MKPALTHPCASKQAIAELSGFKTERRLTQRFRATQTVAVLKSAEALLLGIKDATADAVQVPAAHIQEVAEGITFLQPFIDDISARCDDMDDAI